MNSDRNVSPRPMAARQLAFAGWREDDEPPGMTSDDWYTPPELVEEIRDFMGGDIDLDPCAARTAFVGARVQYFEGDDGLTRPWSGTIDGVTIFSRFINPPYSKPAPWLAALASLHLRTNVGHSIALVKCDTSTRWFRHVWGADAILFFDKRVAFVRPGTSLRFSAPFPSAMAYYGANADGFEDWFSFLGHVVQPHIDVERIVDVLVDRGLVKIIPGDDPKDPRVTLARREPDTPEAREHELVAIDGIPSDSYPFLPTGKDVVGGCEKHEVPDCPICADAITVVDEPVIELSPIAEHPQAWPTLHPKVPNLRMLQCQGCGVKFRSAEEAKRHVCLPGGAR